ncbi:MAG: glycosidase [Lachnospiraceae bacterium]|nr:glycosidase [Lachnospiraceae bacterium]
MKLYNQGVYECKFEFEAEDLQQETLSSEQEVLQSGLEDSMKQAAANEESEEGIVGDGFNALKSVSVSDDSISNSAVVPEEDENEEAEEPDVIEEPADVEPAVVAVGDEATEEKQAVLLINGKEAARVTVEVGTEDIYFRLASGTFTNSTESGWVKSLAIAGSFDALSFVDSEGESRPIADWNPADENAELTYVGGGIWSGTFLFEELSEDVKIKYKTAANDEWDMSWGNDDGSDDGNISLTIPSGSSQLTVYADTANGNVYDSIRTAPFEIAAGGDGKTIELVPFSSTVSLIGTVRGGNEDWTAAEEGWEFTQISDKWFIRTEVYAKGSYEWKTVYNHSSWSNFDNKAIEVANDDTFVIFLFDAEEDKIYDSINDKSELGEMLGLATGAAKQEVIRNANDTLRFVCSPVIADDDSVSGDSVSINSVDLVYGVYNATSKEVNNPTTVTLKANKDGSFTSNNLYFGDEETTVAYYYKIDEVKTLDDSAQETVTDSDDNQWSAYVKPSFEGRNVSLPGTVNANGWDPAKESEKLTYKGNGIYEITVKNMAAGNYQYKIAIDGSWAENYGAQGEKDGANMNLTVSELSDVTFTYNDISHLTVNSIDYIFADIILEGTGIPEGTKLTDDLLNGVYSVTVDMSAGTYKDIKYLYSEKDYPVSEFTLNADKAVTFYFDPVTEIYYNDASDVKVETTNIFYDSKDTVYKDPYGAIEVGTEVKFSIQTGDDAEKVALVVKGKDKKTIWVEEPETEENGKKIWSMKASFDKIGEYHYFFAVSNGSAISIYSDDEAKNYGIGMSTDLLNAVPYDLIVYQKGYKTPDWMKDAVIYQIFPERFYNGDVSNDTITSDARGSVQYEYMPDWYIIPKNPEQMELHPDTYPTFAYKGDENFSNDIYGGDLKGITKRIDYLKELGITVIYLNPVFESISAHRYDTSDYMNIDPILGTLGDFEELVEVAADNGMHVVLDGVFNHVSDDSVYFDRYYEYLEEGTDKIGAYPYWAYVYDYMAEKKATQEDAEKAAKKYFTEEYGITNYDYVEWFDVFTSALKDDKGEEVCDEGGLRAGKPVYGYDGWWGYDSMPIIKATNGSEYQTGTWAKEVIGKNETSTASDDSVTQYWLSKGMDGWRLDVANEVSDETWQHFRKSVKALDSDNVIIGEIWTDASEYLLGDMYDSVMNYMFRNAAVTFVRDGKVQEAVDVLERLRERYPEEAFYAMMNLVDSHDTTRILSYLDGIDDDRNQKEINEAFPTYENTSDLAKKKQYLIAFMQFTYAGAPTIYYGDELGMVGADDPDDRRPMIWGQGDQELVEWYAKLAKIRSNYTALRTGSIEMVETEGETILSYVRRDEDAAVLVMMNNGEAAVSSTVNVSDLDMDVTTLTDLVTGTDYSVTDGSITVEVPALKGVILVDKTKVKASDIDTAKLKYGYDPAYEVTTAERAVKVTGVTLSKTALALKSGETAALGGNVTVAPANATTKGVKWYSSDKKIATVDKDGKVTAIAAGTATITVKTNDGLFPATCKVTVTASGSGSGTTQPPVVKPADVKVSKISISGISKKIAAGKKIQLTAKVTPANATNKAVTWKTSNKKYATVNSKGKVTLKKAGIGKTVTITATAKDGSNKKATYKIKIMKHAVKSVKIKAPAKTVKAGKTLKLKATVTTTGKSVNKTLKWTSSNTKYATVSKKGVVKAKKAGKGKTVTITVMSTDGTNKKAKVKIKIK